MIRIAKAGWRWVADWASGRSKNPYATHVPVLVGLSSLREVRRVLELGCGEYSTLTFLDRSVFPRVEVVHSYENDREWWERMRAKTAGDSRLSLRFVDGPMRQAVSEVRIGDYDVVFVDDSTCAADRAATITAVAAAPLNNAVVVVHDYEVPQYRTASAAVAHRYAFTALNPNTGVLWDGAALDAQTLERIDSTIKAHRSRLEPGDLEAWHRTLGRTAARGIVPNRG